MAINWKWPGWIWLEHAGENALGAAALGAGAVIYGRHYLHLADVPWSAMLTVAVICALASLLKAVGTVFVGRGENNGTASWNPRVIAATQTTSARTSDIETKS